MRTKPRMLAVGDHVLWRGRFGHVVGFYGGDAPYDGDVVVSFAPDLEEGAEVVILPEGELKLIDGKRYL